MNFSQVMEHRVYLDVHESIIYLDKEREREMGEERRRL